MLTESLSHKPPRAGRKEKKRAVIAHGALVLFGQELLQVLEHGRQLPEVIGRPDLAEGLLS